jgi:hypothetical protein
VDPVGLDRRGGGSGSRGGGALPAAARAPSSGGRRRHHCRASIRSPPPGDQSSVQALLRHPWRCQCVTRARERGRQKGNERNQAFRFGQPVVLFPLSLSRSPRLFSPRYSCASNRTTTQSTASTTTHTQEACTQHHPPAVLLRRVSQSTTAVTGKDRV